jgi:hypothetical protein
MSSSPSTGSTRSTGQLRRVIGRWPVVALAAWNAFVFSTRIRNVSEDAQATDATKAWAIALATVMLAGTVVLIGLAYHVRTRPFRPLEARLVQAVAGLTVVVWVYRGIEIAIADYSTNPAISSPGAFKVVHLVLGTIAIVLAALAWRVAGRERAESEGTTSGGRAQPVSPVTEAVR